MRSSIRLVSLCVAVATLTLFVPLIGWCETQQADADAQYTAGADLEAIGQHSQALAAWQTILTDHGDEKRTCANAKLAMGRAYVTMGQRENAGKQFDGVIAAYPELKCQCAEAALELARIQQSSGEYGQAITLYVAMRASYPDVSRQCAEAKLQMAACHASLGQLDQQVADLSNIPDSYPSEHEACAEALMRLGSILLMQGKNAEAITEFGKIISGYQELDLWCAEALLRTADAQERSGMSTEALASYERAITGYQSSRPQRLKAMLARGAILERTNKPSEALAEYGAALSSFADYPVQAGMAKSHIESLLSAEGVPATAVSESRNVLSAYETRSDSVVMGDAEQALAEKTGIDAAYPRIRREAREAIMRKGLAFRRLGQYQNACEQYKKASREYDDTQTWRLEAKTELGKTQRVAGLLTDALTTFTDVVSSASSGASEQVDAKVYRAETLEQMGDKDGAVAEYRSVIQEFADRKGRCGKAGLELAQLLRNMGNDNDAVVEYARVYNDPQGLVEYAMPALESAVRILNSQQKFKDAVTGAETVAGHYAISGRYRSSALYLKALIQSNARWFPDAQTTLRQLIDEHPNDPAITRQAQILLAQSLLERGEQQAEARTLLQGMLSADGWSREERAQMTEYMGFSYPKNSSEAETWFTKGISDFAGTFYGDDCYFHRSLCRSARKAYPEALADIGMMRDSYLRHYALGEMYAAQGKTSQAAAELERVTPELPADFHGSYFEPYAAYVKLVELYKTLGDDAKASIATQRVQEVLTEHMLPAE